jgi:hypothetical protein
VRFSQEGNDYTEMLLVLSICVLQATNFIWLWWIVHTHLRMPPLLKKHTAAFAGFTDKLTKTLESKLDRLRRKPPQQ